MIQGIFEQYIDHSFFILRNRIYTTESENSIAKGIIRIAGKRIDFGQEVEAFNRLLESNKVEEVLPQFGGAYFTESIHREMEEPESLLGLVNSMDRVQAIEWLLTRVPRGEVLHDFNRPIVSMALDENKKIIGFNYNQNFKNKTLHSELLLADRIIRNDWKVDQIVCSLKPCKMCAAILVDLMKKKLVQKIVYLENDPGRLAQNTDLDGLENFSKL